MTKKRTAHEICCDRCGSVNVLVETTRTRRERRQSPLDRLLFRRQFCRCARCERRFVRRVRIAEHEISRESTSPAARLEPPESTQSEIEQ